MLSFTCCECHFGRSVDEKRHIDREIVVQVTGTGTLETGDGIIVRPSDLFATKVEQFSQVQVRRLLLRNGEDVNAP